MFNFQRYLPYFTIAVILILLIGLTTSINSCNKQKHTAEDRARMDSIYWNQKIQIVTNENGKQLFELHALRDINDQMIRKISDTIFAFNKKIREVMALIQVHNVGRIDSIKIPFHDTTEIQVPVYITDQATRDSLAELFTHMITVPKSYNIDSQYFKQWGKVVKTGVIIDSLELADDETFRLVNKKSGFLGLGSTLFVQGIHSSPYYKTTAAHSIIVKKPTNAWNKIIKPVLTFGAGFFLARKL